MYIPRAYRNDDRAELLAFVRASGFGILISAPDGLPMATHLPFTLAERGDELWLRAHFARANPHWESLDGRETLVIFHGPHAYVSPSAYDSVTSVPTWNYVAVHAYGRARLVHEPEELESVLEELIQATEPAYQRQWNELPDKYRNGMLGGIVGVELRVQRLEGKWKLSQNKTPAERARIAAALDATGDANAMAVAALMRERLDAPADTA